MRKKLYLILLTLFFAIAINGISQEQQGQTYESAIRSGEEMLAKKEFISAKTYFEMALRLREGDDYATRKLNETLQLLRQQMELQENFFQKMDFGDRLYRDNKFEEALKTYREALEFIPTDSYTLGQVEKISTILRDQQEKIQAFDQSMELGQNLLEQERYEPALLQFEQAKAIFPERDLPKQKIAETRALLDALIEKENRFEALRLEAETLLARRDYTAAIAKLEEALALFPDDQATSQKLSETIALKSKAERYETALARADELYTEQSFREARVFYQQALAIWPEQTYPKDMVSRIDNTLNDSDFIRSENFNELLAQANGHYDNSQFALALNVYNEAAAIKADDAFVNGRIAEIDALLAAQLDAEKLEADYAAAMATGEAALSAKHYEQAIASFNQAIALKPGESRPKSLLAQAESGAAALAGEMEVMALYQTTIEAADALMEQDQWEDARLLYLKASELPVDQNYPNTQIARIDELISQRDAAEIEAQYQNLIQTADARFGEEAYEPAKTAYLEASRLFADRPYPLAQISKIDDIISARTADLERENAYASLIEQADQAFNSENWMQAKNNYEEALQLKPGEAWPDSQLAAIEAKLTELADAEATQKAYDELISSADQYFETAAWDKARLAYSEALSLKANEAYPANRIAQIDATLAALRAEEERQNQIFGLLSQGNRYFEDKQLDEAETAFRQVLQLDPAENEALAKIKEIETLRAELIRQNQARYDEFMAKGEQALQAKDYREAVTAYKTARSFKPGDALAEQKIEQAESLFRDRMMAIMTEYNKHINDADRHFNNKAYDRAIESYSLAERVNPDETYPREMINNISKIIEENKLVEVNLEPVQVLANSSRRFDFSPVNVSERRTNYIIIKARNLGENEFPLIFSYGSKDGRQGGFVLPIPSNPEYQDYIVRIGSQYRWFSEDNNYFSVTPENGDIEISLVQISRGN